MKLKNKCAIITGASQGLGYEIAKQFLQEGATVMLCARNSEKLNQARQSLANVVGDDSRIFLFSVDISQPDQVSHLFSEAVGNMGDVDILIANAGVYGAKGSIDEVDWEEWSRAIDINLKGTVLTVKSVLPHFRKKRKGKIVFLSGGGATKPLPFLSAYAASKAAVVRFCETLAMEVKEFGIDVNAIAPGALNTRLLDEILEAGPEKVGKDFYARSVKQKTEGGTPLELGAKLSVFLSSDESDGITGKLISAVWDPWKTLPSFLQDLKETDIYTLRRIIPKERGKVWGEVV